MTFSHNPHLALILYTLTNKQIYIHATCIIVRSNWPIRFISWMWLFLLEVCHLMHNSNLSKLPTKPLIQWDYIDTVLPHCMDIFIPNETIYKQTFWLMSSTLWVSVWSSYFFFVSLVELALWTYNWELGEEWLLIFESYHLLCELEECHKIISIGQNSRSPIQRIRVYSSCTTWFSLYKICITLGPLAPSVV